MLAATMVLHSKATRPRAYIADISNVSVQDAWQQQGIMMTRLFGCLAAKCMQDKSRVRRGLCSSSSSAGEPASYGWL